MISQFPNLLESPESTSTIFNFQIQREDTGLYACAILRDGFRDSEKTCQQFFMTFCQFQKGKNIIKSLVGSCRISIQSEIDPNNYLTQVCLSVA